MSLGVMPLPDRPERIDGFVLKSSYDRLQAENAKLRKLLDYMTPIAWYAASERERDRMRELGIEVGEAGGD